VAFLKRLAHAQAEELEELSLAGHATTFNPFTRDVVEVSLWLTARRVIEEEFGL